MKWAYSIILAIAGIATVTTPTHTPDWRAHGWGNYMDKVLDLAWDPADPDNRSWYTAAPGGLYHTNDLAESFRITGDDGLDNLILSGVAVARDAPHILYVTTGYAGHPRRLDSVRMPGNGVYRSSDHGATWTRVSPELVEDDLFYLTSVVTSALGDTVLISTPRRIMRSLDSGATWEEVLVLDPALDSHSGPADDPVIDLLTHERNLQTVIAVQRDRPFTYAGAFYRIMVSYDGASTWDTLRVAGRVTMAEREEEWNIAFAPTADSVIWAQSSLGWGTPKSFYRSADHGVTWGAVPIHNPDSLEVEDLFAVHPRHADSLVTVYSHSPFVYRDGRLEPAAGNQRYSDRVLVLAADDTYHRFRIVVLHPEGQQVRWATSGRGATFRPQDAQGPRYATFNNAQVRDVCKLPTTSAGGRFRYLASGHHLGLMVGSGSPIAREDGWSEGWMQPGFGLATQVVCHPGDRTNHALAVVRGGLYRTDGRGPNQREAWQKGGQGYGVDVVAANPDRVFVGHGWEVLRSDDFGVTWDTLAQNVTDPFGRRLSPDFVHISRADPNLIYAGDILSRNGGDTWEQTQWPGLETYFSSPLPGGQSLRYTEGWLEVKSHPSDPSVIWTCTPLDIRRWDDELARSRVLATREDIGRCHDLLVMPTDTTWLWAGTQTGLWESTDGGGTWVRNANGLPPAVPVTTFDVRDDQIIVGTYGRGIFSLPQSDVAAIRTRREIARHSVPEDGEFLVTANWPNPFNDATTISFEAHTAAHIRMEIYDATGRRMAVLTDRSYAPGLHAVRWNAKGYGSGIYFARMMANGRYVDNRHLVLRK